MKKKCIALFLLMFILLSITKAIDIPGGVVYGRWEKSESPYRIRGSLKVPEDKSLIIDAGVIVEFQGNYKITVKGRMLAEGTQDEPILFSIHDTAGIYNKSLNKGGWQGILIVGPGSSVFRYCQIEYVRNNCNLGAAIAIRTGALRISNCSFSHNISHRGGAISGFDSDVTIDSCYFLSNSSKISGGAIYLESGYCHIENNIFVGNESRFGAGMSIINASSVFIRNNDIKNNYYTEYGGGIYLVGSFGTVDSNRILKNFSDHFGGSYNRYGSAVYAEFCDLQLKNNQIYDNTGSGSVYYKLTNGAIIQNNICRNYSDLGCGGIILFQSNPYIFSNILFGNDGSQLYLLDITSQPTIRYCKIENGLTGIKTLNYFAFHGNFENNETLNSYDFAAIDNALTIDEKEEGFEKFYTHSPKSLKVVGNISNDTYWNSDTIKITGDITVEENAKLYIQSGTIINNNGSYSITVKGTIIVEGSKEKPIKLMPSNGSLFIDKLTMTGSDQKMVTYWNKANRSSK